MPRCWVIIFISFFLLPSSYASIICNTPPLRDGSLDVKWIHGSANCSENSAWLPLIQVHKYDEDTYILRQNKCLHYEAPFFYLLFGQNKVLLEDTGAGPTRNNINFPIRDEIEKIINQWLAQKNRTRDSLELIVAHSHGHGDHHYFDSQFQHQSNTTVVGLGSANVAPFFGITSWPDQVSEYSLGQRSLAIIPIPGHSEDSIAFHDCQTNLLLTGDSMYAGRLYINHPNISIAISSVDRLQVFIEANRVSHVLGTHIEMTKTPGIDYPIRTTYQPNEHVLELPVVAVKELQIYLTKMRNAACNEAHNDFIIYGSWPDGFTTTCPPILLHASSSAQTPTISKISASSTISKAIPEFCPSDFYGSPPDCRPCLEGGVCPGGFRLIPLPGYWKLPETSYESPIKCSPPPERCLGGRFSECGTGYRGLLCADVSRASLTYNSPFITVLLLLAPITYFRW